MASKVLKQSCSSKPKQDADYTHTWSTRVTCLSHFQREYDTDGIGMITFNIKERFCLYSRSLGWLVLRNYNCIMVSYREVGSNYVSTQVLLREVLHC